MDTRLQTLGCVPMAEVVEPHATEIEPNSQPLESPAKHVGVNGLRFVWAARGAGPQRKQAARFP
jgi:hypothetical protein